MSGSSNATDLMILASYSIE